MSFSYRKGTVSGSNIGVESVSFVIQEISDVLQNEMGWTLTEDRSDQAGTNHKVILQSNGEDGLASTFYMVLTSGTFGGVEIQAGTYWDTGTHTAGSGTLTPTSSSNAYLATSPVKTIDYWIAGDKDSVNLISKTNGAYGGVHFGRIRQFTDPTQDPFPIYVIGDQPQSTPGVDHLASTTADAHSFLDATTALTISDADWESWYDSPLGTDSAPDNVFNSVSKFVCLPVVATVSDGATRKSVRGLSRNLWTTIGPGGPGSFQPEDIFDAGNGRTYQVFFDSNLSTATVVIRRS